MFPADLILVESSTEGGQCFIQTSSLDGEKNLKKRAKPKDFAVKQYIKYALFKEKAQFPLFKGKCECDEPNAELYEFSGNLKVEKKNYALSSSQLLIKGSILKNTQWVVGVVVYTGSQTKLMMNAKEGYFKSSQVENKMNKLVIYVMFMQLALCMLVSFIGVHWFANDSYEYTYLSISDAISTTYIFTFFTYFLLLNTLIPISLIVTIEVVKIV